MKLAAFDFDGTITHKDTYMDFISFANGRVSYFTGLTLLSPILTGYSLGLISNGKLKECMLKYFFKGWTYSDFREMAFEYRRLRLEYLIKRSALDRIMWHKARGHVVVVVTASLQEWITDWCNDLGIELIANKLEIKNGCITGKLQTPNCSGKEKVRRIKQLIDSKKYNCDYTYAYGNSKGDRHLLEWADEKYYKYFRK